MLYRIRIIFIGRYLDSRRKIRYFKEESINQVIEMDLLTIFGTVIVEFGWSISY
jgi:hypothetical protein